MTEKMMRAAGNMTGLQVEGTSWQKGKSRCPREGKREREKEIGELKVRKRFDSTMRHLWRYLWLGNDVKRQENVARRWGTYGKC